MRAAEAVILYDAKVWAEALRHEKYRKRIVAVQRRSTLRIACSYRTVFEPVVPVVAVVIPIDLQAKESQFVQQQKAVLGKEEASRIARSTSIEAGKSRWEQKPRGRWTARLISRIDNWINREEREVDFYLTQFWTGHGLFLSYLAKMRKVAEGNCPYGDSTNDDDHHTFFRSSRYSIERQALEQDLGDISPDNVVEKMLRVQEEWKKVA
ncbi:uncharacterized protein LOC124955249 [Vespa velutina]|uniref:uncharacterized protein LOC124955249 n=1 Tax=Vespa velutina TaxID=202808 RepID=UPI001FB503A6|nr:uncharacterized protein LOC124955249 [Vespa velutina]